MLSKKTYYLFIISCLLPITYCFSQVQSIPPPRQVIGSAGNFSVSATAGISLSYTVGETVTETFEPGTTLKLTQGFQQPSSISILGFSIIEDSTGVSCKGANNGSARITVLSIADPPITFTWMPSTVTPVNTLSTSTISNLVPGTYYYTVTDAGGFSISDSVVILDSQAKCEDLLTIWTGITPNGDNHNDTWIIDGIEFFPKNRMSIFNRWGDLVWEGENYDNTTVIWKGDNQTGQKLPSATYFYVVSIPDRKTEKGWVELTR